MGRGKRREPGVFPLPIVPRALSFPYFPASPQHKEAAAATGRRGSMLQKHLLVKEKPQRQTSEGPPDL